MREPVSGHEVVKKKRDCNNLEKETASLEKVKVIARIHTDFPTKFGIPRQSGLSDATGLVVFESEFRQPDALRGIEEYTPVASVGIFGSKTRIRYMESDRAASETWRK